MTTHQDDLIRRGAVEQMLIEWQDSVGRIGLVSEYNQGNVLRDRLGGIRAVQTHAEVVANVDLDVAVVSVGLDGTVRYLDGTPVAVSPTTP